MAGRTVSIDTDGLAPDTAVTEADDDLSRHIALREALRRFEASCEPGVDEATWKARREKAKRMYDECVREGLKNYKSPLPADASEQDILDYAVQITRRR